MEGLDINSILSEEQISDLFASEDFYEENQEEKSPEEKENNDETAEEINKDDLFSESVGSGVKDIDSEDQTTPSSKDDVKSSPNKQNFYSSTLGALAEDGVFTGLSEEDINAVTDAESFASAVEKVIASRLDETQKRINDALNYGVTPDEIKQNEAIMNFLNEITEEMINDESERGEKLRKDLIAQDLLNKGYNQDQVSRKLKNIFDSAQDIDEASEALEANKNFFTDKYNNLVDAKRKEKEEFEKSREKETAELKKDIMENKELLGGVSIDKLTRQRIFDNVTKPIHKDKETGELLTEVQLYQREHRMEFIKNLGIIYTLTDGFKNIDKLVNGEVNKKVRKSLKELEHTINSTTRHSDGSFNYMSGVSDENSYIGAGVRLDI